MAIFAVEARESLVDRNTNQNFLCPTSSVEARESLVDRNIMSPDTLINLTRSRLARASWIEITLLFYRQGQRPVEARESLVDRNFCSGVNTTISFCRGSREPRGSKSQ